MELTLLLFLCLGRRENYSLGLICILKLPVKWSRGRSSIYNVVHMKARGGDDIYLQLRLGARLNQCAEAVPGSDSRRLLPLSPVCLSLPK